MMLLGSYLVIGAVGFLLGMAYGAWVHLEGTQK